MRMWMVNPKTMCRKHLLGEHVECHMLVGSMRKRKSMAGYISNGLVELDKIQLRHDAVATEMTERGYNHKSPLPEVPDRLFNGVVDRDKSLGDLYSRCDDCRRLKTNG